MDKPTAHWHPAKLQGCNRPTHFWQIPRLRRIHRPTPLRRFTPTHVSFSLRSRFEHAQSPYTIALRLGIRESRYNRGMQLDVQSNVTKNFPLNSNLERFRLAGSLLLAATFSGLVNRLEAESIVLKHLASTLKVVQTPASAFSIQS